MLFNSLAFLIFFPTVTALYYLLPHRRRWLLLLVASCVFYGWYIPRYLLVLATVIFIDYVAGLSIEGASGRKRAAYLAVSLLSNIGLLAVFKYLAFFDRSLADLAAAIGLSYQQHHLDLVLPIGLSFHTFQAMSYTLEV